MPSFDKTPLEALRKKGLIIDNKSGINEVTFICPKCKKLLGKGRNIKEGIISLFCKAKTCKQVYNFELIATGI